MAESSRLVGYDYKDVLRYVYDSEECKIDSAEGRQLKQMAEKLCVDKNDDFLTLFHKVNRDIIRIKEDKKRLFQAMYQYSAQTFLGYYKQIDESSGHKNLVLWQVSMV